MLWILGPFIGVARSVATALAFRWWYGFEKATHPLDSLLLRSHVDCESRMGMFVVLGYSAKLRSLGFREATCFCPPAGRHVVFIFYC